MYRYTVVIETALSCGINLLKQQELNPLRATTYGLGELFSRCTSKRVLGSLLSDLEGRLQAIADLVC